MESTGVSGRPHRINRKAQKRDWKAVKRNKKRMTIWLSPENYKFAKEKLKPVSEKIDSFIESLRTGKPLEIYVFGKKFDVFPPTVRARGSAWLERSPDKRKVRGSNPRGPMSHSKNICILGVM